MAKRIQKVLVDRNDRMYKLFTKVQKDVISKLDMLSYRWEDVKQETIQAVRDVKLYTDNSKASTLGTMSYEKPVMTIKEGCYNLVDKTLEGILIHEFMHKVAYYIYKNKNNGYVKSHGKEYKSTFRMLGYNEDLASATVYLRNSDYIDGKKPVEVYKYQSVCTECGRVSRRFKRKVDRTNWHSGCCKAKLRVEAIK